MTTELDNTDSILLLAHDGTVFQVPCSSLQAASPIFSSMLDIPKGPHAEENHVQLQEPNDVLSFLTKYLTGSPITCTGNSPTTTLLGVFVAADKYVMEGLQRYLRVYCAAHWNILAAQPLVLYSVVRRAQWREFYWRATRETLKVDIREADRRYEVETLLTPEDRRELQIVRGIRYNVFNELLTADIVRVSFRSCSSPTCRCGSTLPFATLSVVFDALGRFLRDLRARPLGDFVTSRDYQLQDAFITRCPNCDIAFLHLEGLAMKMTHPDVVKRLSDLYPVKCLDLYDDAVFADL